MKERKDRQSNIKLLNYLRPDRKVLLLLAVSGIIFNVGLVFIPVFEGWLVQCLADIIKKSKFFKDMLILVGFYLIAMLVVQISRYLKRKYVREVANNMVVRMRDALYVGILKMSREELSGGVGEMVTRASLDVEIVAEGTRKVLTAIFDIGVLIIAFAVTMLIYDVRVALIALAFTPLACIIAEILKKVVYKAVADYKKSGEALSNATYDRVMNESLYRVYGRDAGKNEQYKAYLFDYEKKAVKASVWENTLQPIYNVISLIGVIFIVYLGGLNYLGKGISIWDIATFTTFISCYVKVAEKSSKVAQLFNTVQKTSVSWHRLKHSLAPAEIVFNEAVCSGDDNIELTFDNATFGYGGRTNLNNVSFCAKGGQIIGVTGAVASGKSTFGRAVIGELPYDGSILVNGKQLGEMSAFERSTYFSYLGHNPELFSDTIRENVLMGKDCDLWQYLRLVSFDKEVQSFENGENTEVGGFGIRLSGGQKSRLALARTLVHAKKILVLDDPFSAVDMRTEKEILARLRSDYPNTIIILLSHRLSCFDCLDKVLWLENGTVTESTHAELYLTNGQYKELYEIQRGLENV